MQPPEDEDDSWVNLSLFWIVWSGLVKTSYCAVTHNLRCKCTSANFIFIRFKTLNWMPLENCAIIISSEIPALVERRISAKNILNSLQLDLTWNDESQNSIPWTRPDTVNWMCLQIVGIKSRNSNCINSEEVVYLQQLFLIKKIASRNMRFKQYSEMMKAKSGQLTFFSGRFP